MMLVCIVAAAPAAICVTRVMLSCLEPGGVQLPNGRVRWMIRGAPLRALWALVHEGSHLVEHVDFLLQPPKLLVVLRMNSCHFPHGCIVNAAL